MKKIALILLGIFVLLGIAVWWIGIVNIVAKILTPNHDFSIAYNPPALDYSLSDSWAALPQKEDYADLRPTGIASADTLLQKVDVFFIHPTSYFKGDLWNERVDLSTGTYQRTDKIIAYNASIFNDCKVYAPRYRQATIVTFLNMEGKNEQQALGLAYEDVRRAFLYFLKNYNQGRPFILAGHSQGSYHGKLLIEELIDKKPLAKQMIAAYLMGTSDITNDWAATLSNVTVCNSATETHCIINFNTYADDIKPSIEWEKSHVVCVNPLNWKRDGGYVAKLAHLGYVKANGDLNFQLFGEDLPDETPIGPLPAPIIGHTHVKSENGVLLIENQQLAEELEEGNYHGLELSLFHMNIRANVAERSRYFLENTPYTAQ